MHQTVQSLVCIVSLVKTILGIALGFMSKPLVRKRLDQSKSPTVRLHDGPDGRIFTILLASGGSPCFVRSIWFSFVPATRSNNIIRGPLRGKFCRSTPLPAPEAFRRRNSRLLIHGKMPGSEGKHGQTHVTEEGEEFYIAREQARGCSGRPTRK